MACKARTICSVPTCFPPSVSAVSSARDTGPRALRDCSLCSPMKGGQASRHCPSHPLFPCSGDKPPRATSLCTFVFWFDVDPSTQDARHCGPGPGTHSSCSEGRCRAQPLSGGRSASLELSPLWGEGLTKALLFLSFSLFSFSFCNCTVGTSGSGSQKKPCQWQ